MTSTVPEYVDAEARVQVWWVPAIADLNAPTVAEITAGVALTCYSPDEWEGLTVEVEINEQTRMCMRDNIQSRGRTTRTASDFRLTYLPNPDGTIDPADVTLANKAKAMMTDGTKGNLVIRYGVDVEEQPEPQAGDEVDVQPVECVSQTKNVAAANQGGPLTFTQKFITRAGFTEDAVVAA